MALFCISGLAVCGFASLPLRGPFFYGNRMALFMSLCIMGRKVMSCRLISLSDCENFHSRSVSRVLPRDVSSAGALKMSNINIEAWFRNLLSFDIMP